MNDDTKDILKMAFIMVAGLTNLFGLCVGGATAYNDGKCEYRRIVDFQPGNIVGCELFRDWTKR